MKSKFFLIKIFVLIFLSGCAQQKQTVSPVNEEGLSFPGAEGFGRFTTGGRGGKVMIVSNLDDDGPGSFREAASKNYPRIIVFSVSGTIHLKSRLNIKADATIAGQTAPGDGICFADYPVVLGGNNIIIRFLRFRMGDRYQNGGMVNGSGSDDAFGGVKRKNIVVDHCSMSWSTDEVCSIYGGDSTTLQWNFIYEPLNYSYHFETGDKDFEHHGYGGIWGGRHTSAHHNLFAHCNNRNPRFDGIRNAPSEFVDYRNNVIYNWGSNTIYAGEGGEYNIVNNYFKYGPSTNKNVRYRIVNPGKREDPFIPFGKWFVSGNHVDGAPEMTLDNQKGVVMGNKASDEETKSTLVDKPHDFAPVLTQSATLAYEDVLDWGGCVLPNRDTLDQRIVGDVRNRTGRHIDVQGGLPHGTPYDLSRHAWPLLRSENAPADRDKDGMPDEWEIANKLNPDDAGDASIQTLNKHYTNIEVYINGLALIKK